MAWVEKHQPTPFDNQPIEGFFYLDGDALARLFGRDWTVGQKYAMLAFPSGEEYALWESSRPERLGILHLFGEMDLPLRVTRDEALAIAEDIAEQCGYQVAPQGDDRLELIGHDTGEHLVASFDPESGRIADVTVVRENARVAPLQMELLPDKIREKLPPLYANEEIGLEAPAVVKFFTPDSSWTWYASEFDGEDTFFGLVIGLEIEFGYFSLAELRSIRGPLGLPIERDRFFETRSLRELRDTYQQERNAR